MGLGALVGASECVRKQGGELKLLNVSNKVTDVMQITKLYTVFDIATGEVPLHIFLPDETQIPV